MQTKLQYFYRCVNKSKYYIVINKAKDELYDSSYTNWAIGDLHIIYSCKTMLLNDVNSELNAVLDTVQKCIQKLAIFIFSHPKRVSHIFCVC